MRDDLLRRREREEGWGRGAGGNGSGTPLTKASKLQNSRGRSSQCDIRLVHVFGITHFFSEKKLAILDSVIYSYDVEGNFKKGLKRS